MNIDMRRTGITILCCIFLLQGCGEIGKPSPQDVLSKYLDAKLKGQSEQAYAYISSVDQSVTSKEEYVEEESISSGLAATFSSKVHYEIVSESILEDRAEVIVSVTAPDVGAMFTDMMGAAFASAFGGEDSEGELEKKIAEKYKDGELPLTTSEQTHILVKESDGWRVYLDFKSQKLAEEKRQLEEAERKLEQERKRKASILLREARDLAREDQHENAILKYKEVLELDANSEPAKEGIKTAELEIENKQARDAYITKVELKDFRVGEGTKYGYGDPKPAVFGTVVNNGDRILSEVEITVYFLNEQDSVIGEEDFHPVLISPYSMGDNKPLKPNYEKDFGYGVEDYAPSSWSGKARAEITDIEFLEE
jgi:hypothetical protein